MKRGKRAALTRRGALALIGAVGACTPIPPPPAAQPYAGKAAFVHGVASGDPGADRLIIWTRASPDTEGPVPVTWVMAEDAGLQKIAARGVFTTDSGRDYTVKVDVGGLKPGRVYHYAFSVGEAKSPVGRARTLPKGGTDKVVLAAASCASYSAGFFNAYEALAQRGDVQFVVHLGDYIYEYGMGEYGTQNAAALARLPAPMSECLSLADYRARYAQARGDRDLQAAHAAFAFIHVWDDHETANDSWTAGAQNHNPENGEGEFEARRDAAVRAFYEWVPIRDPEPAKSFLAINRAFQFGDLATLIMLETRLLARTQQLNLARDMGYLSTTWDLTDPDHPKPVAPGAPMPAQARVLATPFDLRGYKPIPVVDYQIAASLDPAGPGKYAFLPDLEAFQRKLDDPARMLLGPAQEKWVENQLFQSARAGCVWQVFGNQTLMGKIRLPSRAEIGPLAAATLKDKFPRLLDALALGEQGVPAATLDSWDGYPAQRARLFKMLEQGDANAIVLTGDSHQAWAIELYGADGKTRVACEFGVASITSPGIGKLMNVGGADLAQLLAAKSPEVKWSDPVRHGFTVLTLTKKQAIAEFVAVSSVTSKEYSVQTAATFTVAPQKGPQVGPAAKSQAA